VDGLADACLFLMQSYQDEEIINVGVGWDLTIGELAGLIGEVVGFAGQLVFDSAYPDGTPRKLLDVSRLAGLGWQARKDLRHGLEITYDWFCRSPWTQPQASNPENIPSLQS
jgi:GDP-L-fucose synthase